MMLECVIVMVAWGFQVFTGKEIQQYGDGSTSRDYTYVDDIVDGRQLFDAWHNVTCGYFRMLACRCHSCHRPPDGIRSVQLGQRSPFSAVGLYSPCGTLRRQACDHPGTDLNDE
jgi:hypothetical protein